jgi:hypothetical protein
MMRASRARGPGWADAGSFSIGTERRAFRRSPLDRLEDGTMAFRFVELEHDKVVALRARLRIVAVC